MVPHHLLDCLGSADVWRVAFSFPGACLSVALLPLTAAARMLDWYVDDWAERL